LLKNTKYIFFILFLSITSFLFAQTEQQGQQKVLISLSLADIEHIDTKSQTFDAEFYLWLKWKEGRSGKNIEYMNATDFKNIFYDEWADSLQRVSAKVRGTFKSRFDVGEYPFDKQILKIRISDYDWNFDSLTYEVETSKIGISKEIFNDEWAIKLIGATANKEYISEDNFSVFEFAIEIQRKSFSVFIKIIIPLFIIMAIAFLNLFVPKDQIESGIGLGISSLLSIIALHFSISSQLPEVNYATKVDILFIVSFFFNLLLIIWVVAGYNLTLGDKKYLIKKIDRYIKPLVPLLYFLFSFILLKLT
jgi:hypothetical protein